MRALLGIDIGTQGTKAALFAEDGTCLAESFRASQPRRPAPGIVEEDPELQLDAAIATMRECIARARIDAAQVSAIGIAGQMAGVIGIDANGRAVTPYDSWLDTRCSPYIAEMERSAGEEITEKTGSAPSFNHGPKILWWKNERTLDYARIRTFVQPAAYVAMRLGGLAAASAFIDDTYLHFSGFADNVRRCWDDELCRRFAVDPAKLPRIVSPFTVVGEVTADMAQASGLRAGLPMVAGCGDTAASFLACGAVKAGICVDVAGTASVFAATSAQYVPDTRNRILACGRSALPYLWHPYAYVNGGGQNLEWFRRELCAQRHTLDELCALAADHARDERLPFFVPHLGGRVAPSWPTLRGSWVGLSWDDTTGTLFRAVLEGVALEYALFVRALHALAPEHPVQEVRVTGGGEKSHIWNQLKADRLQTRVVTIARGGSAAMGAALVAGHGAGIIPDLPAAIAKWTELGAAFNPSVTQSPLSTRRTQRYAALLGALHQWSGTV